MNKLEFALFFDKYQDKTKINLNSDIVEIIYQEYSDIYSSYTLFELITLFHKIQKNVKINIPHINKKSIIDTLKAINYIDEIDTPHKSEWDIGNINYDDLYIEIKNTCMKIYTDDIIKIEDKRFLINDIKKMDDGKHIITTQDIKTDILQEYRINDFIKLLDHNQHVTIEFSYHLVFVLV